MVDDKNKEYMDLDSVENDYNDIEFEKDYDIVNNIVNTDVIDAKKMVKGISTVGCTLGGGFAGSTMCTGLCFALCGPIIGTVGFVAGIVAGSVGGFKLGAWLGDKVDKTTLNNN